jgi:REP-associated tyrosine transposase
VDRRAALEVARPKHFFDPKGTLPEKTTLELTAPPGFASATEFREKLCVALRDREERAVQKARGGFLGVARVLAQKPTGRPATEEARRALNPRVASRDKWKRIETLSRLVEFLRSYRSAWASRCAGDASVTFPCGTYHLRVIHGVPCAGSG